MESSIPEEFSEMDQRDIVIKARDYIKEEELESRKFREERVNTDFENIMKRVSHVDEDNLEIVKNRKGIRATEELNKTLKDLMIKQEIRDNYQRSIAKEG